jgi:hypothetical protein
VLRRLPAKQLLRTPQRHAVKYAWDSSRRGLPQAAFRQKCCAFARFNRDRSPEPLRDAPPAAAADGREIVAEVLDRQFALALCLQDRPVLLQLVGRRPLGVFRAGRRFVARWDPHVAGYTRAVVHPHISPDPPRWHRLTQA